MPCLLCYHNDRCIKIAGLHPGKVWPATAHTHSVNFVVFGNISILINFPVSCFPGSNTLYITTFFQYWQSIVDCSLPQTEQFHQPYLCNVGIISYFSKNTHLCLIQFKPYFLFIVRTQFIYNLFKSHHYKVIIITSKFYYPHALYHMWVIKWVIKRGIDFKLPVLSLTIRHPHLRSALT